MVNNSIFILSGKMIHFIYWDNTQKCAQNFINFKQNNYFQGLLFILGFLGNVTKNVHWF